MEEILKMKPKPAPASGFERSEGTLQKLLHLKQLLLYGPEIPFLALHRDGWEQHALARGNAQRSDSATGRAVPRSGAAGHCLGPGAHGDQSHLPLV